MARFAGRKGTPNRNLLPYFYFSKLKLFKANICVNFWTLLGLKSQLTQIYDHTGVLVLNGHELGPEEEVTIP